MKKRKKLIPLLCASLLLAALPGCSQGTSGGNAAPDTQSGAGGGPEPVTENAKGRFLETELALPENISNVLSVRKCADNSIVLIGYDENRAGLYREYSGSQGADWEESSLNSGDYSREYIVAAIDEDGSAALFGYFSSENESDILLAAPDGSTSTLPIQLPEYNKSASDTSNMVMSAAYADNRLFIVDFNSTLYEVDTESGGLTEFSLEYQ